MAQSHNNVIPKNRQSFEKAAQSTKIRKMGIRIMTWSFPEVVTLTSMGVVKQAAFIQMQTCSMREKTLEQQRGSRCK